MKKFFYDNRILKNATDKDLKKTLTIFRGYEIETIKNLKK